MESKIDKILAAAYGLLHKHGLRKVTMSDIAEAAGISRPTLYAEFANKDAILTAIVERHRGTLLVATCEPASSSVLVTLPAAADA